MKKYIVPLAVFLGIFFIPLFITLAVKITNPEFTPDPSGLGCGYAMCAIIGIIVALMISAVED